MLASKRLGPSQRIRRRHLTHPPSIDVFTSYLRELLGAPPGARFDFSWDTGNQTYTTTLIYDHRVQIADWKLYKGIEPDSKLVWEHRTNDIPLLFNLISMQTGHAENVCDAEMTLANNHGADLASPEAKHGNYMVRNLQKLFVEAQNNWSPAQYEMEMQNESLSGIAGSAVVEPVTSLKSSGNWPQYAVQAKAPAQPVPEAPTFSTTPTHTVNLSSGRGLLQSLLVNELGVLSFSALLFLLEQEYYKANTNNSNLTVVLFKIASNIGATIPRSGIQQVLHDIKARLRKTDMLAQYESGLFAFVLPETDLNGAKLFARKVGKFLANPQNYPGPGGAGLKVSFGLAGLNQGLPTLPLLLGGAEKALDLAEIGNNPIATYDDFVHSLESPWSGTQSETPATPQKGLNLVPMRQLLGQLLEEELNIFTYAAWLLFLEREFHRAQRSKKMLLTLIIRLRMHDLRANDPSNLLPSEALAEAFQRISHLQKKGDITGHFTNGNYAILRANASIKSLETFSKQIKDALTQTPLTPDFDYSSFRIGIQLCTVRGEAASPDCLNFFPMQIQ